MEKNWRLCGTIVAAIIDNDTKVHFADPDQKGYMKEINKIIKGGGRSITLENAGFTVRICNDIVYVSHPDLPNECVLVNQASTGDYLHIISHTTVTNGVFDGTWSFLVDVYKNFLPGRDGISIYDKAEIEMIRKFSLAAGKKTSSWTPGCSYHNETETIYYLGTVCSWKTKESLNFKFGPTQNTKEIHMMLSSDDYKPTGNETLEEVIKNNFFKIRFSDSKNKMVEGNSKFATGEVKEMVPLWDSIIEKWGKENLGYINKYSNLIQYNMEITNLFSLFEYTKSGEDFFGFSETGKNHLKDIIKNEMRYIVTTYWNTATTGYFDDQIYDYKTPEQNATAALSIMFENQYNCKVYNRIEYFGQMFKMLGIDLNEIAVDVVKNFNPLCLMNNWKNYVNNLSIVENNSGLFTSATINDSSDRPDGYYNSSTINSDSLTTDQKNFFDSIMTFCRDTSKNSSEYMIRNIGTLTRPKYIEVFNITIDTVNRMYKDTEIPKDIQQMLIKDRFVRVTIKLDKK